MENDTKNFQKVEIIGFADVNGKSAYNLDLSKRRAANVAKYLKNKGMHFQKSIVLGKGENKDYDQNRLNRRVEIRFE